MEEQPRKNSDSPEWVSDDLIENAQNTFAGSTEITRCEAVRFVCLIAQLLDLTRMLDIDNFNDPAIEVAEPKADQNQKADPQ